MSFNIIYNNLNKLHKEHTFVFWLASIIISAVIGSIIIFIRALLREMTVVIIPISPLLVTGAVFLFILVLLYIIGHNKRIAELTNEINDDDSIVPLNEEEYVVLTKISDTDLAELSRDEAQSFYIKEFGKSKSDFNIFESKLIELKLICKMESYDGGWYWEVTSKGLKSLS